MAVRGKSINLFLMDGKADGRIKYTARTDYSGLADAPCIPFTPGRARPRRCHSGRFRACPA